MDGAWVAEVVDARDLKSLGTQCRVGSIPIPGTNVLGTLGTAIFGIIDLLSLASNPVRGYGYCQVALEEIIKVFQAPSETA